MKTTLNKIKQHYPCDDLWKKLLTFLNKTDADDEKLSLLTILESNGLTDALKALKYTEWYEKELRLMRLMACDFAESVVHLAKDKKSLNAIKVVRDYQNGLANEKKWNDAYFAYFSADNKVNPNDTVCYYATAAIRAAIAPWLPYMAARWSASCAYTAACFAKNQSWHLDWDGDARAARLLIEDAEREKQVEIFKKYVK